MANVLIQRKSKSFWDDVRNSRHRKNNLPNTVDGVQVEDIAGVFANKFETLYNSVPYDRDDMDGLLNQLVKCYKFFNWQYL